MIAIDPGSTGMLVIEMQNDLVSPTLCDERGLAGALARAVRDRSVLDRLSPVLTACRARGVAVLYATKERHPAIAPGPAPIAQRARGDRLGHGTWGAQVVDAIRPEPDDVVLPRYTSLDPSHGSSLWATLGNLGAGTLIVAGVSTTLAVEGTVRAAANRGYRVVVVEDCCASVPDEWHRFSADNVLPLLGEVVASVDVLAALG